MAPILSRLQCDPQVATCLRKSWLFVRQWPFIDVCNVWNSDKMAAILKTTFPMLFLDRTVLYFDSNFIEVCPWSVLGNDMWLVMGEKKWLVATEQTTNPFPERILIYKPASTRPWWRHRMETFSVVLVLCVGNSPVTDEFPSQKPMTRSVFFDLRLNKRLSKQSWGRWFETPSHSLWRHCNTRWFLVKSPPIHAPPGELVMSFNALHYSDVILSVMMFQITGVSIVYSTVCSGADQRKHQKLRVTGLCEGNSPVAGEFPTQSDSNAENVSIWWRHHGVIEKSDRHFEDDTFRCIFFKDFLFIHCPVCRTSLIATRFWVVMICPIIKCLTVLRVFFYFAWFVFIHHNFQFYFELCTYCNILDIYLSQNLNFVNYLLFYMKLLNYLFFNMFGSVLECCELTGVSLL